MIRNRVAHVHAMPGTLATESGPNGNLMMISSILDLIAAIASITLAVWAFVSARTWLGVTFVGAAVCLVAMVVITSRKR